jgi:cyclophilin family peptidyl-prolyl cis-trans isomerase/HEAT repeat protein
MKTARTVALLALLLPLEPAPVAAQGESGVAILAAVLAAEDARRYDEPAFRRALADPDSFVRRQGALGVGRLRDARGAELLAPLLYDRDSAVQATAAFSLGLLGDTTVVPLLIRRAVEPGPLAQAVALEIVTAAARSGGASAGGFLQSVLDRELWRSRVDAPSLIQRAALESWRLGPAAPTASLVGLIRDDQEEIRFGAVYSLGRLRVKAAAPQLIDAAGDKSAAVRGVVARTFGRAFVDSAGLDPATVADLLVRLTRDGDPGVRVNALRALGTYQEPRVATKLVPLLEDPIPNVQVQAAITLGGVGGADAAKELVRIAGAGKGTFARRREALVSLARVDAAAFGAQVGPWAAATDWRERAAAAQGWAVVNPALLAGSLKDPDARVVAAALTAWGENVKGPDPAFVTACRQLARHRDAAVRSVAADGMARAASPADRPILVQMYEAARHDSFPEATLSVLGALLAVAHAAPEGAAAAETSILAQLSAPDDYVVRRWAEENWPAAALHWGAAYPVRTGRTLEEYRDVVRGLEVGADSARYPRVKVDVVNQGVIELELFGPEAPLTVANFLRLVDRRYFDGQRFHRVVPNFVVQSGDPRGDGWGGPGGAIRDEINPRRYGPYFVGMALSGPDTGGSQWFITLSQQPHLDGGYTIFGRVSGGVAALLRITEGDQIRSIRR